MMATEIVEDSSRLRYVVVTDDGNAEVVDEREYTDLYRVFKASSWAEAYDEVDGFGLGMPEFKSFVYKHLPKSGMFFDQMKGFKEGEVVYL